MKKDLQEVQKRLRKYADPERAQIMRRYMKTDLPCLGIPVTTLRKELRYGFSFSRKPFAEQFEIWDYMWKNGGHFEVLSMPLIFCQGRKRWLGLQYWRALKSWARHIDNWEHSDRLSDLFSYLLEQYPDNVYPVLLKWNASPNPWCRRLSIVSLFYYSAGRQAHPSFVKVLPMVNSLLYDKHTYVQKGIGWTLRELYNVYPKETFAYLKKVAADLPAAAWQASTEKLSAKDKQTLKLLRRP